MTASDREAVATLEQAISERIGEPRYNLWFDQKTRFSWKDDLLVVGVPNHFFQEWLQNTYGDTVRAAAGEALGRPMQVRFSIDPDLFQAARRAELAAAEQRASPRHAHTTTREREAAPGLRSSNAAGSSVLATPPKRTRHWRRLADFVVGSCNRVAHASAVSVVESPGQGANPLVLYGPVGTGKTHLLEGTYAGLRKKHPDWRIRFTTAEDFTNRFLQAMRSGKLGSFRNQFRECDALLIDDLDFMASKRATQEEFLHTFDVLQTSGRQIVITCDCHPKLAAELTPELIDRLLGGTLWGLLPPEEDTRIQLLRTKAARSGFELPQEVLILLASRLRGNVRELEGAIHSIAHMSRVAGRPVDSALARETLGDLLRHVLRVVQLEDIDRAVCRVMRLDQGALQATKRSWAVSHPRMLAMYLARKHTPAAYSEIGQYFGKRNHSTAVAAEKKVRFWLENQSELNLGQRRLRIREVLELAERELLR